MLMSLIHFWSFSEFHQNTLFWPFFFSPFSSLFPFSKITAFDSHVDFICNKQFLFLQRLIRVSPFSIPTSPHIHTFTKHPPSPDGCQVPSVLLLPRGSGNRLNPSRSLRPRAARTLHLRQTPQTPPPSLARPRRYPRRHLNGRSPNHRQAQTSLNPGLRWAQLQCSPVSSGGSDDISRTPAIAANVHHLLR